eukprot:TRINITY_DN387_c0_g2_i11.p1 TRINITY_DN387_c0_g2~~TRINITY_DN387_c0_g2_i11.p1  ORF type:complete len:641 (-),score=69.79 TRINITY_DN387_c0_g2_i11:475-2397(-)
MTKLFVVSLLVLLIQCTALIIPSGTVNLCNPDDNNCAPSLLFSVLLTNSAIFDISVSLSDSIRDANGRLWGTTSPISISFRPSDLLVTFPLREVQLQSAVRTAYEQVSTVYSGSCPARAICCTGTDGNMIVRQFAQNSSLPFVFAPSSPFVDASVEIIVEQNGAQSRIVVSNTNRQVNTGLISTTLVFVPSIVNLALPSSKFFVSECGPPCQFDGFFVGQQFFGPFSNHIGITEGAYLSATNCQISVGSAFSVAGGLNYDQFSSFRSATIQQLLPFACRRLSSSNAAQSFACPLDSSAIQLIVQLSATQYRLRKLFGEPVVTNSGVFPLSPGDMDAILFVDIANVGSFTASVTFVCTQACIGGNCNVASVSGLTSIIVQPFHTQRALMYVKSSIPITTNGYASFDLFQQGVKELSVRVTFGTSSSSFTLPPEQAMSAGQTCNAPSQLITRGGQQYCQSACTIDQSYDTVTQICRKVNCDAKYGAGVRSFFNLTANLCAPYVTCGANLFLWPAENRCVTLNQLLQLQGVAPPPSPTTNVTLPGGAPPVSVSSGPRGTVLQCGPHGRAATNNLTCVCDATYVPQYRSQAQQQSNGTISCVAQPAAGPPILLIVAACGAAVGVLLIVLLCADSSDYVRDRFCW